MNLPSAIRMAEKLANENQDTYHVIKVCTRYDLMTNEHFKTSEKGSYYKAVPVDRESADMELGPS